MKRYEPDEDGRMIECMKDFGDYVKYEEMNDAFKLLTNLIKDLRSVSECSCKDEKSVRCPHCRIDDALFNARDL
ncbi:MAG: hypothetical protein V3V47_01825 [Desulfobacteria bacterium]